jgi:hypothetical protein
MSETGGTSELETKALSQASLLPTLLSGPWPVPVRNPEHRRLLQQLHTAVLEARSLPPDAQADAINLLNADESELRNREATAALVNSWDQVLIRKGLQPFVRGLLAEEQIWDADDHPPGSVKWSDVFGDSSSDASLSEAVGRSRLTDDDRARLAAVYTARAGANAIERTRIEEKARYLKWFGFALSVLAALAIAGLAFAPGSPSLESLVGAVLGGAIGAALSGTFKLRDEIGRISQLRAFGPAVWVQPVIGAVAGLFLLVVLASGLIDISGTADDWAQVALLAFVGGFSEPFFLGLVGRVATVAETHPEQSSDSRRTTA